MNKVSCIKSLKSSSTKSRRIAAGAWSTCLLSAALPVCAGDCTPDWQPGGGYIGINGFVWCSRMWDPDGAGSKQPVLVVGGTFSVCGDKPINNLAAWDGTAWAAVGGGVDGPVSALAEMPTGELVVGGSFAEVGTEETGGEISPNIALWDGSSWQALRGLNDSVYALGVTPGGDLIAGGQFRPTSAEEATWGIARWNGSYWAAIGKRLGELGYLGNILVSWPVVYTMAIMPSGDIVVNGRQTITTINEDATAVNGFVRFNGTTWTHMGPHNPGYQGAEQLVVMPDGRLVTNGSTGTFAWNGTTWSPFGANAYGTIFLLSNNELVTIDSTQVQRWNGSAWVQTAWAFTNSDFSNTYYPSTINTAAALPNGDLVVAGAFNSIRASSLDARISAHGIARLSSTGAWQAMGSARATDNAVTSFITIPSGDVIAGGAFTTIDGVAANGIARWNGSRWSAFGTGIALPPGSAETPRVSSMVLMPNGDLVVGGTFTTINGVTVNHLARWNGSAWLPYGSGASASVESLGVMPNGDLVVGGAFTTINGVTVNHVARWNGANWSPLGSGMDTVVRALAVMHDGTLIAGGEFTTAGGSAAQHIARWNGSAWTPLGLGASNPVNALAVVPNGDLYVGSTGPVLNRWNGSAWTGFPGPYLSGRCFALKVAPDGSLLIGGTFIDNGFNNVARWDGATLSMLGLGVDGAVYALNELPDGEVFAGGLFAKAGGHVSANLARWGCPVAACLADFNNVNGVTVQDIFDFLTAWLAGNPSANFNGVNGVTVQDIFDFLTAWLAGC